MTTPDLQEIDFMKSKASKKQHDNLVSWIQDQYKTIKNARTQQEATWYMNLSMYHGKQHVIPVRTRSAGNTSTRLYTPPAPWWRVRPVINRIRPTVRTELALLTSNRPSATVIPASAEEIDMYAAQAGEQIWDSQYNEKKVASVLRKALWWMAVCGTGFVKTVWDSGAGDPYTEENSPIPQLLGKPMGDIQFSEETPFHIFVPDFREQEIENQPYVIHAQLRSPEFVKIHFGEALKNKDFNPHSADARDIIEESFLNIIGTQGLERNHSVLVLEVWVKPGVHPDFKQGLFATVIGDTIVQAKEGWPFQHKMYPFSKFDYISSGKFYGTSLIEDLIPLQKEYNRTRGQLIEAKNRMARPQLMAPRGSVDASKITTEPGQIIFYTPGFNPPTPLQMQDMPQYVIQEIDRILVDWSDIAGQHEVTKGQVPPGVTAATAISYLQERDEAKLSTTFASVEEGVEKMARLTLNYVKQFWDVARIVKIVGTDGSFDAMAFSGSDIRNNTDIRIEGGSALPVSKAAKQAFIMDLMKMGFIDPNKGLEVMQIGGINKIYDQINVDRRQAQRENLRMSKVTAEMLMEQMQINPNQLPVPVNSWDNHKLHVEVHNNFRKGQKFEALPDEIKALFEAHVQQHIAALGFEQVANRPNVAAGLPDMPSPEDEEMGMEQESSSNSPGPEPMPEEGAPVQ